MVAWRAVEAGREHSRQTFVDQKAFALAELYYIPAFARIRFLHRVRHRRSIVTAQACSDVEMR